MWKELLVTFFVCLMIGAIINGMSAPAPAPAPAPAADTLQPAQEQPQSDAAGGASSTSGSIGGAASGSTSLKAQETGDANFDQDVLKSQVPVLVDFSAAWCQPCQTMAPIMDNLASDYSGKAKVFKVDTDHNPILSKTYNVNALPTFVMFRNGQAVSQYSGAMPKEMLAGVIDHQLGTQ